MVWPHPLDVIQYARSSYYYDNMLFICLFSAFLLILKSVWSLIPKNCRNVCHNVTFLDVTSTCFCLWFHACNLFCVTSPQKQITDVSFVLKYSDMDSENLSSLIRLSVSDGQKTDSSKVVSVIGI